MAERKNTDPMKIQKLPLDLAKDFFAVHDLGSEFLKIERGASRAHERGPGLETTLVRRGYVVQSLEDHGLLDKFISEHWPRGGGDQAFRIHIYMEQKRKYDRLT